MAELHDAETKQHDIEMLRNHLCPETGIDLRTLDPVAHAEAVWPTETMKNHPNTDAARRKNMILAYARQFDIETSATDLTNQKFIESVAQRVAALSAPKAISAADQAETVIPESGKKAEA